MVIFMSMEMKNGLFVSKCYFHIDGSQSQFIFSHCIDY